MFLLLVATAAFAVILYYLSRPYREKGKFPPGPTPLPALGNLLEFRGSKKSVFEDVVTLANKYGSPDAVTIWTAMLPGVFINTFKGVRQTFIDNQHDFASRPDLGVVDVFFDGGEDIILGKYTPKWAANKKIGSRLIRRVLESGKLESNVVEATDRVIEDLRKLDLTEPLDIAHYTTNIVYNILISLCFGTFLPTDHPRYRELLELRHRQNNPELGFFFVTLIPGIEHARALLKYYKPYRIAADDAKMQLNFVQRYMDEHRADYDRKKANGEEMDDMVYAIIEEQRQNGTNDEKLDDITAKLIILDIFAAGTETTATTLRWFATEMAANLEVQEELARSVKKVVGSGIPTLQDRPQLPLVEAALLETMRLHPAAPLGVAHVPSKPGVKLLGKYEIPQDTIMQYNIYGIQRDPELFPNPNDFNPYRFVEEGQCIKPQGWIPFGVGRRVCLGEQLAKNDLFLVITTLLQNVKFMPAPNVPFSRDHEVASGLTNLPKDQKFQIELRN